MFCFITTETTGTYTTRHTLSLRDALPILVTWGTSPEDALPIGGSVPDPAQMGDAQRRTTAEAALRYMGLAPGTPLTQIPIDVVFIGSCTRSEEHKSELQSLMRTSYAVFCLKKINNQSKLTHSQQQL